MRLAKKRLALTVISVAALQLGAFETVFAQAPTTQEGAANGQQADAASGATAAAPSDATSLPAASVPTSITKRTYTVPAGTKVLLQLRSALNTKSAKPGDGVYLASTFPVVVGNRVMIPSGVYVQGVVDRVERAGRVKGRAQLDMHFTSIIFPNGTVVEIPGWSTACPAQVNNRSRTMARGQSNSRATRDGMPRRRRRLQSPQEERSAQSGASVPDTRLREGWKELEPAWLLLALCLSLRGAPM